MQGGTIKTEKVLVCKLLVPVLSAFVYSSSKNWGTLNITSQDKMVRAGAMCPLCGGLQDVHNYHYTNQLLLPVPRTEISKY